MSDEVECVRWSACGAGRLGAEAQHAFGRGAARGGFFELQGRFWKGSKNHRFLVPLRGGQKSIKIEPRGIPGAFRDPRGVAGCRLPGTLGPWGASRGVQLNHLKRGTRNETEDLTRHGPMAQRI